MDTLPDAFSGPWLAVAAIGTVSLLLWAHRPEPPGIVASCARSRLFGAWYMGFAAIVWTAPLPVIIFLRSEYRLIWVWAIVHGFGLGALVLAVRRTRDWLRHGARALHVDPYPLLIGGDVGGWLDIPVPHSQNSRVLVTLRCEEGEECDGDEGTRTFWQELWAQKMAATLSASHVGTRVTFAFQPPAHLPASEGSKHQWSVSVDAKGPGVDFTEYYGVTVSTLDAARHANR